ncbi:MAG TPA: hypothetical protein VLA24_04255, partial [Pseudomonadales bacterium]|nr:hypothetical protein [Pseudomonadales bacterium]
AQDSLGLATDFDEDWFQFDATAGQVLSFNVSLADGSSLSRPMVEVVNAAGSTVAIGDGLETDNGLAVATFKVASSGTYYARVIDGAGATGTYTASLTLGDASDEDANGPVTLTFADDGVINQAELKAKIGLTGDTDNYQVVLQQGHSYRIETVAVRDGSTAPLGSAALDMEWTPTGAGPMIDAIDQTLVDNGDGTFTLNLTVADIIAPDWQDGLSSLDLRVNFDASVYGVITADQVTFPDGSIAVANTEVAGQVSVSAVFFPTRYQLDSGQPLVSLTFAAPAGDPTASPVVVDNVIFDTTDIEPIASVSSPSFFDEGFITADADGVLSINVSPLEATQTGQYILRVVDLGETTGDDHINTVAEFDDAVNEIVAINESVTGTIEQSGDTDLFAVNLTSGNIYDFSIKSYFDG